MDDPDRCPRCGDTFRCGAADAEPCACTTLRLTAERLAELRQRYTGCLCLRCLAALAAPAASSDEVIPAMRRDVALAHASRLVNHGPTVLVCTEHAGRRNVMAAAWSMPVEFTPPRIAVVVDKKTFTRELLQASGCFALCLPVPALADLSFAVGSRSGREVDKFAQHAIAHFAGPVLGLPLVEGCCAWLELRHLPERRTEELYDTVFGEVVSAQADDRVFAAGRWLFRDDNAEWHTLHHLGAGSFAVPSRVVQARPPA